MLPVLENIKSKDRRQNKTQQIGKKTENRIQSSLDTLNQYNFGIFYAIIEDLVNTGGNRDISVSIIYR